MILGHVNMVHYPLVNIDETDDSWQTELDPSLTGQPSKNWETKQESTDAKMMTRGW